MGRKSKIKKQKRQSIDFVEQKKRRWLETPQNWWPELSDEAQSLMWGLQLELCCKVNLYLVGDIPAFTSFFPTFRPLNWHSR